MKVGRTFKGCLRLKTTVLEEESLVKKLLENKSYGYYVTLALSVLSVVIAVVYAVMYNGSRYMSMPAAILPIVGAVAAVGLGFVPGGAKAANAVLALCDFVALLFYIYGIYFYVSIVLVGIQASSFNSQFVTCTGAFVALLIANLVNVFLKQVKEVK